MGFDVMAMPLEDLRIHQQVITKMLDEVQPMFKVLYSDDGIGYSNLRAELKHFRSFYQPLMDSLEEIEAEIKYREENP